MSRAPFLPGLQSAVMLKALRNRMAADKDPEALRAYLRDGLIRVALSLGMSKLEAAVFPDALKLNEWDLKLEVVGKKHRG